MILSEKYILFTENFRVLWKWYDDMVKKRENTKTKREIGQLAMYWWTILKLRKSRYKVIKRVTNKSNK